MSDGIIDWGKKLLIQEGASASSLLFVLYTKLQVGVLRRMQLYGFSQRFLGSSDIGDQINPLVNVAVILILITVVLARAEI